MPMTRIYPLILALLLSAFPGFGQAKKSAAYYHEKADEALDKKRPHHALETLNECLRLYPYDYDAYYTRGLVREQLGEFDGALTDYNIYLETNPIHTEALFSRATLRYKQGQYELAKADFRRLLSMPHSETTTVFFQQDAFGSGATKVFTTQGNGKAYLYNYLGLIETKLKNYPAAIHALDSAILLNSTDADLVVNRGLAKDGNKDTEGAIADYQRALSINPDHGLARHNLGVLRATKGPSEESEKLLLEAIEKNPNLPYPHAQLAYHKFNRGDYKGSLEEYNRAINIDSTDVEYYLNRALVYEKLKDYENSLFDFNKALTLKSNYASVWFNRGNLLTKLNRLTDAIEDYTIAIFYDSTYAAAYYNRALNRNKLGLTTEACEDLIRAQAEGQVVGPKVKSKICKENN